MFRNPWFGVERPDIVCNIVSNLLTAGKTMYRRGQGYGDPDDTGQQLGEGETHWCMFHSTPMAEGFDYSK